MKTVHPDSWSSLAPIFICATGVRRCCGSRQRRSDKRAMQALAVPAMARAATHERLASFDPHGYANAPGSRILPGSRYVCGWSSEIKVLLTAIPSWNFYSLLPLTQPCSIARHICVCPLLHTTALGLVTVMRWGTTIPPTIAWIGWMKGNTTARDNTSLLSPCHICFPCRYSPLDSYRWYNSLYYLLPLHTYFFLVALFSAAFAYLT